MCATLDPWKPTMSKPKVTSSPDSSIPQADPRSRNPRKSGAYGYLARTKDGREIPSDLALVESQVIEEVEMDGPLMRIKKQAIRLATASEILWGYMLGEKGAFEKGLRHWGWLVGAEIRAWREYETLRRSSNDGVLDYEQLLEVRDDSDTAD